MRSLHCHLIRSRFLTHLGPSRAFLLPQTHRRFISEWPVFKAGPDHLEVTVEHEYHPKIAAKYLYVWLRDNCQCPSCVHPDNRQKLHSSSDVSLTTAATAITENASSESLTIQWAPGSMRHKMEEAHTSTFDVNWLKSYSPLEAALPLGLATKQQRVLWTKHTFANDTTPVEYKDYMETQQGLWTVLTQLHNYGLCFLKNVPTETGKEVEAVAERIGCIKETFYGRSWDVKSVPKAKNIAYTSLDLGLHMDLLYFEAPPGIQLLHCLKNTVKGGLSTFMDSFKVAKMVKEAFPHDYEVLKQVPVTFHYRNDGHLMTFQRPTIIEDDLNEPFQVYYAPPFQGPLEIQDPQMIKPFYSAFQKFADMQLQPNLLYRTRLQPGDLVLFNNRRVLHGRTEFDSMSGERHLKGSYVDLDMFKDRLNALHASLDFETRRSYEISDHHP